MRFLREKYKTFEQSMQAVGERGDRMVWLGIAGLLATVCGWWHMCRMLPGVA
jgi:hypothetical protein